MADKSFGVKELNLLNASGTPTVTSPNNLNLNANTVAISTSCTIGNNLTVTSTTNSANLNVTGIGTLTRAFATDLSVSGVTTITVPANANPHSSWDVVNNSASSYRFTGPGQDGAEDNPNIYLVRGQRYVFKMNASGHPFQLRVANGGAAYSDGVTNNGAQSGNVVFNVQHDAPAQLYYQCTSHGSMVGNIYIVGGPQVISGVVTATTFVGNLTGNPTGSGANLTNLPAANLTGTLPAISGANLTSLPAQATIANNADNRVITGGSGVNLNGESGLTYNGSTLGLSGSLAMTGGSISLDGHSLIATAGFTDISGGSYAARLGSTGSSTIRSTQIYGGGSHLATFDGVNNRLGINVTAPTAKLDISAGHYLATNSGKAVNGIHIRGQSGNSGEFGGGISFGCNATAAAAIAAEQMSSDADVIGLAFFTHETGTGSDDAEKKLQIPNSGGLLMMNQENNRGYCFDSTSGSRPTEANVQGSGGTGMIAAKKENIAQNTVTALGNSHWGGLAYVGYSGTGHQGFRLVAYGYGGAGVQTLFSGQWVGSLTTTFSMSLYTLRVSHNASNSLNFWLINIGV